MTIRHLRIFIAVAEAGTMSGAARELYIAQPTVSQVIGEMEDAYGVQLFERLSKKLYITEAGKQLLQYSRHIVALFDEMERSLRNAGQSVTLRIGATLTVGSCLLAGLLRQFEETHPTIHTRAVVDNSRVIEKMLLEGTLDLALVEGQFSARELIVKPVIRDELVIICGQEHPFAKRTSIRAAELDGQDLILREPGSGTRALFEERMKNLGIPLRVKWTCYSSDAILSAAAENLGLGILSKRLAEEKIRQGILKILPVEDMTFSRYFSLVYHRDKFLSKPIQQLIKAISAADITDSVAEADVQKSL